MQGTLKSFKVGSQCRKILDYLKQGKTLTVAKCLSLGFGANLRSRVSDLKNAGHNIVSRQVNLTGGGYIAEYSLKKG